MQSRIVAIGTVLSDELTELGLLQSDTITDEAQVEIFVTNLAGNTRTLMGKTELEQRRYFMKMLVVHPKVVLLRAALGEDIDVLKVRWAITKVEQNEQRYGLGMA